MKALTFGSPLLPEPQRWQTAARTPNTPELRRQMIAEYCAAHNGSSTVELWCGRRGAADALRIFVGYCGDWRPRSELCESQELLGLLERELPAPPSLAALWRAGRQVFSQNEEDGLLEHIFGVIGCPWGPPVSVEMSAGDGRECNTANLAVNHHFHAVMFEGNANRVRRGRAYWRARPEAAVSLNHAWISAENAPALLRAHGVADVFDLLSIDMDGVDWAGHRGA